MYNNNVFTLMILHISHTERKVLLAQNVFYIIIHSVLCIGFEQCLMCLFLVLVVDFLH